jgi:hypothetical protein
MLKESRVVLINLVLSEKIYNWKFISCQKPFTKQLVDDVTWWLGEWIIHAEQIDAPIYLYICMVFIYNVDSVSLWPGARHFKTEPTKTVVLCFGIPENTRVFEPIDTVKSTQT